MSENHRHFDMLVLITTPKLAEKANKMFVEERIPVAYRMNAQGTAPSEIIDMLGLGNVDKKVLIAPLPRDIKSDIFHKLSRTLKFHTVNSGIAFSLSITSSSNVIPHMFENIEFVDDSRGKGEENMSDKKYSMITVIANRGYSVEVMEAAKEAGASGGSVINSRQIADEGSSNLWGLGGQEEKEIILIVTDNEKKVDIMRQISKNCGVHSEVKGVVMSFAIDDVIGIGGKKED